MVVQFWFDFASTYSYPAAAQIESVASAYGAAVEWNAFLLGPVFKAQGWNDSPFNIYPAKGKSCPGATWSGFAIRWLFHFAGLPCSREMESLPLESLRVLKLRRGSENLFVRSTRQTLARI